MRKFISVFILFILAGCGNNQSLEEARFAQVYDTYIDRKVPVRETEVQLALFRQALRRTVKSYVNEVNESVLVDEAIKGIEDLKVEPRTQEPARLVELGLNAMLAKLDPHSSFLNPEQAKEMESRTKGEFGGLGIEINKEKEGIKVIAPIDGTPAQAAGIRAGDLITHVDGESIVDLSAQEVVKKLRGKPGSQVRILIKRENVPDFEVEITRAIIVVQPIKSRIENNIAYIRITTFNEKTSEGLIKAVNDIKDKKEPRGYIIDLRNNPGGLLDQAVKVSDAFLDEGGIVSIKSRVGRPEVYDAGLGDITRGGNMVVLINGGAASAAEIVAGALQDHERALVMGTPSFGKGSVQTIMPLNLGAALKLTTSLYYTPSGRSIQAAGIEPDILVTGLENEKELKERKRESDLSHALPSTKNKGGPRAQTRLEGKSCPEVKEDRLLGCAIMFLEAGNKERFISLLNAGGHKN